MGIKASTTRGPASVGGTNNARRLRHRAKRAFSGVQRGRWRVCLVFYLFWYQIGWQPVGCKLKTAYISAHWKNLSFERYGNYLPFHFPRLSGWCSLWLVQPVNWLAGSASQRSNSMHSHTKYFKSAKNWIVSLYGPFFELTHVCTIFPMYGSSM